MREEDPQGPPRDRSLPHGRSPGCSARQGIEATAAPCSRRETQFPRELGMVIPAPGAAGDVTLALDEWLGLAWYHWRGRI